MRSSPPSWTPKARSPFQTLQLARQFSRRLPILGAVLLVSCSRGPATSEVSGTITVAEGPLTRGIVNFLPDGGGAPVGGPVSTSGEFRFRVPLGSYRGVVVAEPELPAGWKEGEPLPPLKLPLADRYANPATSGITLKVESLEPHRLDLRLVD